MDRSTQTDSTQANFTTLIPFGSLPTVIQGTICDLQHLCKVGSFCSKKSWLTQYQYSTIHEALYHCVYSHKKISRWSQDTSTSLDTQGPGNTELERMSEPEDGFCEMLSSEHDMALHSWVIAAMVTCTWSGHLTTLSRLRERLLRPKPGSGATGSEFEGCWGKEVVASRWWPHTHTIWAALTKLSGIIK